MADTCRRARDFCLAEAREDNIKWDAQRERRIVANFSLNFGRTLGG